MNDHSCNIFYIHTADGTASVLPDAVFAAVVMDAGRVVDVVVGLAREVHEFVVAVDVI